MKIFSFIAFLSICFVNSYGSQPVQIYGNDTSYAGSEIIFYKYSDWVSETETEIARCKVTDSGSFSLSFNIDETTFIFAYLGVYKVHLFTEPEASYHIVLPPMQEKEFKDFLNPYFSPTIVHLATIDFNEKELNSLIRMFNDAYQPFYNKHIMDVHNKRDFTELDKNIEQMDKPFSKSTNPYFNDFRKYRYGMLRYLAYQQKSRKIAETYFKGQKILFDNPAYMELFNKLFDKYLQYFSRTETGKQTGIDISNRDLAGLQKTLATDSIIGNSDIRDLVMLKGMYDEFYNDAYSRNSLLAVLDTFIAGNSDIKLRQTAEAIRHKTTKLLTGFDPPAFELYDADSNLVSLEKFRGKYVYLNFCSCFSYACLNEFAALNNLNAKYKDKLQIVTIIVDNDKNALKSFLERSNYSWIFLHYGNQSTVIKDYDIRAFPTYYLIDPQGKLVISPCPSPLENFEAHFFKVLRARGEI
jgi:peroxiredoxin